MRDPFAKLTGAAHSGAFALGAKTQPTPEQVRAGNYKKGSLRLHGLPITIETPMFTPRTGKSDGAPWSIVCMANYGYINGTRGADGDQFDVYVGPTPESQLVIVVNQTKKDGSFDEHKAVLGFHDQQSALAAYMNSYERGWKGLGSFVACTMKQFKAWLKAGDLTRPLVAADLIHDEESPMSVPLVSWNEQSQPVGQSVGDVIYAMRREDRDGLLLDSATMADIEEQLSDGSMLDALVIEFVQFKRKANQLLKVMQLAGAEVKAESVEISKPFKNRGTTQVAMLFTMSDGQSVSVFFHNPDTTPNKLAPDDELISWKWVLNKKDITVTVAPEKGQDLNPRQVARRIMALVEKNSPKFLKAASASAEKSAQIESLKAQVESKTGELQALDAQIVDLTAKRDAKKAAEAAGAAQAASPAATPQSASAEAGAGATEGVMAFDGKKLTVTMSNGDKASRQTRNTYQAVVVAYNKDGKLKILSAHGDRAQAVTAVANAAAGRHVNFNYREAATKPVIITATADSAAAPAVSTGSIILEDYADVAALGAATVVSVGSENVYFDKDGQQYMTKLLNTDDYEDKVGQVVDLSGVTDPNAAPAATPAPTTDLDYAQKYLAEADAVGEKIKALGATPLTRDEFMAKVNAGQTLGHDMPFLNQRLSDATKNLADLNAGRITPRSILGRGAGKKAAVAWLETSIAQTKTAIESGGIMATVNASNYLSQAKKQLRELEAQQSAGQENQDHGLGADDAEAQKIARLLEMLAGARARLAGMAATDAFYGNLVRDIADMAKQLWDAGYRGPEASAMSVAEVPDTEPGAQPDMLGNDPSLEDNRSNLEKLTDALKAGNTMGALGVLDAIEDVDALRLLVLEAGFSLGASGTKDEILAGVGKNLVRAAKAKTDGFGLRELDKPAPAAEPSTPSLTFQGATLIWSEGSMDENKEFTTLAALDAWFKATFAPQLDDMSSSYYKNKLVIRTADQEGNKHENTTRVDVSRMKGDFDPTKQTIAQYLAEHGFGGIARGTFVVESASTEPPAAPAEPDETEDTGEIAPEGRENTVKTAKGTKVVTGFKVIEAKNLVISHGADGTPNPDYPSELQPRDRARATSQAWVQKTARALDPDSLGRTNRADSGAPIVGSDRVVESGNGRAMAIREAYRIGQADEYREWLMENAEYFKVDAAKIARMKAPVLVRVRVSKVNRAEFAVEANQDDKLAMTATEKARSDAKRLDSAMLAKLADGDLTNAANRDFIAAFLQSLGDAESAQYLTSDGRPTSSLVNRVQAALFAGAYSDDRLLELTADVSKPEIANIVSALNSAAPDFMRAKEQDITGAEEAGERVTDSVELSLNQEAVGAIINATNMLRQAKESGMGLEEFLRQGDMFGDVDPAVAAMAMFIQQNNRSAKRLGTAFKAMAQFVETENARKQTAGLFGDAPASFTDIVKAANTKLEQEYGEGVFAIAQNDLFSQSQAPDKDSAMQAAKAYLDSIINGTADLSDHANVLKEVERIYETYNDELGDLVNQAAEAFSQYALKQTADTF